MQPSLLKDLLYRFNKYAFQCFTLEMLRAGYGEACIMPRADFGEGIFLRDPWDDLGGYPGIYVTHYVPVELLKDPSTINVRDPEILQAMERICEFTKDNPIWAIMFFLNSANYPLQQDQLLLPQYELLIREVGIHFASGHRQLGFGNLDSFVDQKPEEAESALLTFFKTNSDGISITLSSDKASVSRFASEKPVFSGVARQSLDPYEPVFTYQPGKESVLQQFEDLIVADSAESVLEEFLRSHYREIFGAQYDRIETQLWLRFPELDIAARDRRIDLFLRNAVINDWELFEVKRSIRLTRDYRDMPVIAGEVSYAMQQVKNYARILSQDLVKRKFAAEGIEYYEPELHLVIGRRPQLSLAQWRRLVADNAKDVKLITFDDLLKEMKLRLQDRNRIAI